MLSAFEESCVEHGLLGLSNKAFHQLFPDLRRQEFLLTTFVAHAHNGQILALVFYLLQSDRVDQGQLQLVYEIIDRNEFDFSYSVFSCVCAEFALDKLSPESSTDFRLAWRLMSIFNFVSEHNLVSKTKLLLMRETLLRGNI